jgi:hypothetical protein
MRMRARGGPTTWWYHVVGPRGGHVGEEHVGVARPAMGGDGEGRESMPPNKKTEGVMGLLRSLIMQLAVGANHHIRRSHDYNLL